MPIAVGAILLAPRLVPESRDERERNGFDVAGAFTVTAGLAVLIYALVDANSAGWGSAQTIGLLTLAAVLLVSFVVIESRTAAPLVPFDVFQSRTRTGAYATGLLVGASLFSMFFFISLYMQQVLGWDALKSGLAYLLHVERDEEEHREQRRADGRRRVGAGPRARLKFERHQRRRARDSMTTNDTSRTAASTSSPIVWLDPQPASLASTSA